MENAVEQFWKQLASISAVKGGHVEYLKIVFHTITLHCNDRGQSFLKLTDCSIKYVSFVMPHPAVWLSR